MRVYATETDLLNWTGQVPPDNAVSLLRAASSLVEDAAMLAHYPTDTDGMPNRPAHATAFMEATCEQTSYWAANKLDPNTGGLDELAVKVASSKSIKGASVSYDAADSARAKQARVDALSSLCAASFQILRNAGLISTVVNR